MIRAGDTTPLLLRRPIRAVLFVVAVFVFALVAVRVHAVSSQSDALPTDGRIITLHDRGLERAFVTKAATIEDALKEANIEIDSRDRVEPALSERLVADEYTVNIYRARPLVVVDGMLRQKIMTASQVPEQIAKDAGITLYPEDIAVTQRSTDFIGDGASEQFVIVRAMAFTFTLYGDTFTARTQAKTVGDMLKEKNITLKSDDRVSISSTAPLTPGMDIRVWREGKQTITVDEVVKFGTEEIKDANREVGYKETRSPGTDGARKATYEIIVQDGVEVSRTEIASIVTKEQVKEVVVVGAKLPTPLNPTEAQQIGKEMMLAAGFAESEWPCLYNLWMRESGWRTTAGNPSSGAYGIPQSLPASKMATYGADYLTNARTQIAWGLSYVKGRYQTPCGAWSSFQTKGWY